MDGEDHDAVGPGDRAVAQVGGHGGLPVGAGGEQPDCGQVPARRHGGEERPDGVLAPVGERRRGHGQQAVPGQHRYQGGNVAGVPGCGEPVRQRTLGARAGDAGRTEAPGGPVGFQSGPGPLQGAGHRGLGGLQDLRGLGGGEAQHVPQQKHGALPRRQQLHDGQEGQLDALADLIPGGGIAGRGKLA
jgi:hypothetical protein